MKGGAATQREQFNATSTRRRRFYGMVLWGWTWQQSSSALSTSRPTLYSHACRRRRAPPVSMALLNDLSGGGNLSDDRRLQRSTNATNQNNDDSHCDSYDSVDSSSSPTPSLAAKDFLIDTPDVGKIKQPSKTDLYDTADLLTLLNLHTELSETVPGFDTAAAPQHSNADATGAVSGASVEDNTGMPSLQDLIEQTVSEIDGSSSNTVSETRQQKETLSFDSSYELQDFERILPKIRAVVSDVDGTLLASDHTLHPLTKNAIQQAVEAAFSPMHSLEHFILATGKTRAGALGSLGPDTQTLLEQVPGVYVQGLYCVDAAGKVIFERKLNRMAVQEAEALANRAGLSVIAYDGDALFATKASDAQHLTEICAKYGEPSVTVLKTSIADYEPGFHKLLFMEDDTEKLTSEIRPLLEDLASKLDCVVTQAIPTMLELLPSGCSKAVGLEKLCNALGLDLPTQVCAIGDAENDLDMLRLAAVGIAVANADATVKEVADVVLHESNNEGGAGRAIEFFGLGKTIELMKQD